MIPPMPRSLISQVRDTTWKVATGPLALQAVDEREQTICERRTRKLLIFLALVTFTPLAVLFDPNLGMVALFALLAGVPWIVINLIDYAVQLRRLRRERRDLAALLNRYNRTPSVLAT